MIKALKNQARVQVEDWITGLVVILAGTLVGEVILQCVMRIGKGQDTYVAIGTVVTVMMALLYSAIMTLSMFRFYFNIEVSMGSTRKDFFLSFFGINILWNLVYVGVVALICQAENSLCRVWFPASSNELDFLPYVARWGIPLAFLLPMVMGLCSAAILRYGKKMSGILLILWMTLCIGGPRVSEAVRKAPNSLFGKLGRGIMAIIRLLPGNIWLCLMAVGGLACLGAAYLIMRRQEVTM